MDVMTRRVTIFACSLLLAGPVLAQADQHAAHHPASAATTAPAGQMPMAGSSMMSGDMAKHHATMHARMMAKSGMHKGKHDCAHHKTRGAHRHCKARHRE
jgi:hypothetical protein